MNHEFSFAVPFSSTNPNICGLKVHFHRNLAGYLFPSQMTASDKTKATPFILAGLKNQFPSARNLNSPMPFEIKETFPEISQDASSYLIDTERKLSCSILDLDHLVVTHHTHQTEFKKLLEEIRALEAEINPLFNFAFSQKLGFLTSKPEYSGLGISLEAFLFCPGLDLIPDLDPSLHLERYSQHPSFFVLKTLITANCDLSSLIQLLHTTINNLKEQSQAKQAHLLKSDKGKITDQVARSLAVLKGAYQLNYQDTLDHLLALKMGYHLGLLDGIQQDCFLQLLQHAQRGHLSLELDQKESKDNWLHERAKWMQEKLNAIHLKVTD